MKKQIKKLIILGIIATLLMSSPVYAAEMEDLAESDEREESVASLDVQETEGDGNEGSIIDVTNLTSSEENNCQLTIAANLPEHFDANVFVQLKNIDNGNIYQYTLYAVNNHSQRGYVPDGEYCMTECSVYGDVNNAFPFALAEDFTMKHGDVVTINIFLENEQAARDAIEERTSEKGAEQNKNDKNTKSRFTSSEFCVKFNGAGSGRMAITGVQSSELCMFVKVTKPGIPGNMAVDISLDDGLTYFLTNVEVPYSGMVSLPETGLTLIFEVPQKEDDSQLMDQFCEGDTFRAVIHDPKSGVHYGGRNKGRVKLELIDANPDISIYDQMVLYDIPKLIVEVIKGGSAGEAVVRYSLDGEHFSDEMLMPFSGSWPIDDTTLSISFSAQAGDLVFETGDSYTAEPFAETQNGYLSFLAIISLLFIAGMIAVCYFFKKQVIPHDVYMIHEYEPVRYTLKT